MNKQKTFYKLHVCEISCYVINIVYNVQIILNCSFTYTYLYLWYMLSMYENKIIIAQNKYSVPTTVVNVFGFYIY